MTWLLFAVATGVVLVAAPRLARVVEALARRSEVGDVLVGAVLLGAVTSLPGLVLTVVAASQGETELAFSNAMGGVAAQTFFVAIADVAYRRGTLSSGVPTREVGLQAALLVILLAVIVIGLGSPELAFWRFHAITPTIVIVYIAGLSGSRRLGYRRSAARADAVDEDDNVTEGGHGGAQGKLGALRTEPEVERERDRSTPALWGRFAVLAALLSLAGFALALSGSEVVAQTGLSATSVGFVFTSVATSTPELVTAVAAARRGAIGLAAGDIIGGNVFDILFLSAADVASGDPLLDAVGSDAVGMVGVVLAMNGLLLAGLLRQGPGRRKVDTESLVIVAMWVVAVVFLLS